MVKEKKPVKKLTIAEFRKRKMQRSAKEAEAKIPFEMARERAKLEGQKQVREFEKERESIAREKQKKISTLAELRDMYPEMNEADFKRFVKSQFGLEQPVEVSNLSTRITKKAEAPPIENIKGIKKQELEQIQIRSSNEKSDESEEEPNDKKTETEKQLDDEYKKYDEFISNLNKESFKSILQELETQKRIFVIGVNTAEYYSYKNSNSLTSNGLILNIDPTTTDSVVDAAVKRAGDATTESSDANPDEKLSTLVPELDVNGVSHF
jgi:hypothetical protein